jgi:biotin carboxylase
MTDLLADARPVGRLRLVLVDTLVRPYREYLLESIAARFDVWLFQAEEPGWQRAYVGGHTAVDTLDSAAMVAAARPLGADGVLCWDDTRLVQAAELAEALGLPGGTVRAVRRCRDKHLTRRALAAAGVPQPRSEPVDTLDQARAAVRRTGYPVVLKPRALAGSYGVVRVDSEDQLEERFRHARGTWLPEVPPSADPVLVEEYLDGPEISIDACCRGGEVTPLFVARKRLGYPPYFEEVGHVVDAADPLGDDAVLRRALAEAHAAVGMDSGWTHTEFRLTADGPKLIEINARLGGDMIPYLGWLATGIDPGGVAADIACGRTPVLAPSRRQAAGIRFCYPPHDGVAGAVRVDDARLPAAVQRVQVLTTPGQRILLPPRGHISARFAFVIAVAGSTADCLAALESAAAAVTLDSPRATPVQAPR